VVAHTYGILYSCKMLTKKSWCSLSYHLSPYRFAKSGLKHHYRWAAQPYNTTAVTTMGCQLIRMTAGQLSGSSVASLLGLLRVAHCLATNFRA
jgi:hypothetical protein